MEFAIMFQVLEGGVSEPIKWSKDNLTPDSNIIILDEGSSSLYLWYGAKQGLVSRRTALRQAESLKGHGFSVGKSIVGRDIKDLKEIDQRKIGRVAEIDELNDELQTLLNKKFKPLDDYTVTFELEAAIPSAMRTEPKPEPKPVPEPKLEPKYIPKPVPTPISKPEPIKKVTPPQPKMIRASEYDTKVDTQEISEPVEKKVVKTIPVSKSEPSTDPKSQLELAVQAKIGFVIIGVLDHYDDIWISKKENGGYSVEHMDGKVCEFSIFDGKIKFTSDSFSGISTNVKTEIQRKFVELSKII